MELSEAYGYVEREGTFARGADGSIDPSAAEGRLSLSALNRLIVTPAHVTAASTTSLVQAAASRSATRADEQDLAAAAAAIDPVTAAAIFDPARRNSAIVVSAASWSRPACNPSCSYDARRVCALASGNVLRLDGAVGELHLR